MASLETVQSNKSFGGVITKYKFESKALGGLNAQFNVFVPESDGSTKFPVLWYLAGLTCNEDTGPWKGGFLRDAADAGIALIFPDTSPRGAGVQGEDDDWQFGTGAGFYLNATADKWAKNYRMRAHIIEELPAVIQAATSIPLDFTRQSIFGHSMGGLGALTLYLKHRDLFVSCSAFAPISNPTNAPWGHTAFGGYLKGGVDEGKEYDPTELIKTVGGDAGVHILVDYGDADNFYKQKQLLPENLVAAAEKAGFPTSQVTVRAQPGYDHSYYFISTFAPEHIKFHAKFLKA
ncbi:putative esterase D [Exidia glandulosa HHB12029]|uniref:S-formylglutathione hydrolase n=1 Tax=Exidia glandulosa HHB12029 TaxID=1314781 RepID=A0A165H209_EXIGL|nr:putative esterase D [Exidia glandulosa HHB12029]